MGLISRPLECVEGPIANMLIVYDEIGNQITRFEFLMHINVTLLRAILFDRVAFFCCLNSKDGIDFLNKPITAINFL